MTRSINSTKFPSYLKYIIEELNLLIKKLIDKINPNTLIIHLEIFNPAIAIK